LWNFNVAEDPQSDARARATPFSREIGVQETRKLRARRVGANSTWSGLGMLGLIGWSVATPTLIGALLGTWIDKRRPGSHSWTLALLIGGLCIGCINAWHWMAKDEREINAGEGNGGPPP
jgi:ATP synthase protein I